MTSPPSPRVITACNDLAGQINGVTGQKTLEIDKTYASSFTYAPCRAIMQLQMHMNLGNSLWEDTHFNSRLQPVQIGLGQTQQTGLDSLIVPSASVADKLLLDLCYSGTDTGCLNQLTSNNGNILWQRIRVAAVAPAPALDLTQSYVYNDPMNRLTNASETPVAGSAWPAIVYGMDPYGNRWVASGYKPNINLTPQSQSEFSASTNRMVSPSVYDNSGNLVTDKVGRTFSYDAENRQVQFDPHVSGVAATTYQYDGDGRRVRKSDGTIYVYNAMGQLAAEYNGTQPGSGTSFLTSDHLGSPRLITDRDANVKVRHDYLPYGEEIGWNQGTYVSYGNRSAIAGYGVSDPVPQKFTGKERDSESGLDNFLKRYHASSMGRFMSPDPLMASASTSDPQTWNRYAYVRNNPLKYVDPTGMVEMNAEHCNKDPYCFTIKVNVIYDKNANGGEGLKDKQKAKFEKHLLQDAKDEYGDAKVHFEVSRTEADESDRGNLGGVVPGALNVIVGDSSLTTDSGVSWMSGGYALTAININMAEDDTLSHEMAHHFTGDTRGLMNASLHLLGSHFGGLGWFSAAVLAAGANTTADILNGTSRWHLGNFGYSGGEYNPNGGTYPWVTPFNQGARDFQDAIRPTQK